MEKASEPKPPAGGGKRRGRGSKRTSGSAIEDRVLKAEVPAGSRFKGYESFVVQDLVLRPRRHPLPARALGDARRPHRDGAAAGRASTAISGRSCAASCWPSITRAKSPCRGW